MAEAVFNMMGEILTRWTMGSAAAPAASLWKAELGAEPLEAELRLLALSGQFLGVAVAAETPVLHALPDIPVLELPTVPEHVRPLVRRLLALTEPAVKPRLLAFLAARGWTVHPGDWMPVPSDQWAPEVYDPWRVWVEAASSTTARSRAPEGALTAESWGDYGRWALKLKMTELRRRDPAMARALMETRLGGEDAETRLRLLESLAIGLSEADAALLETLVGTDRAPKVKELATALLGRLGRGAIKDEVAAELKSFFKVGMKGLLKRARVIQFENAEKPAQWGRRSELMEGVDVASFAGMLGITGSELIAAWPWHTDEKADYALVRRVIDSGSDELAAQTADVIDPNDERGFQHLVHLLPRLSRKQGSELAIKALRGSGNFALANFLAGGALRIEDPLTTSAGARLRATLGGVENRIVDQVVELQGLGIITARDRVGAVMGELHAAGVVQGDPRLDMLRLNEALEDRMAGGANP